MNLPSLREHLQAPVLAVGEIDHAVIRHADGVRDVEVGRAVAGQVIRSPAISQLSLPPGGLPKAPQVRLNAPVSASNTMTR